MKTLGLIGGMSWESTQLYYEYINKKTKEMLGGFHSSKCILNSIDFAELHRLQMIDDWDSLDQMMVDAARQLENAGAEIILICANTMHLSYPAMINQIKIPVLHIAEATGEEIRKRSCKKVALLGTKFTMERDFYKNILSREFNIEVIIPSEQERDDIHNIIYEELVQGIIRSESKIKYQQVIERLVAKGAEGIILGCTEIPLLISDKDASVPLFNTTKIHAENAVQWVLQ